MAICTDCIAAKSSQTAACEGLTASVVLPNGGSYTVPITAQANPLSEVGYDYVFTVENSTYTIISITGTWLILDGSGGKINFSDSVGTNNGLCPPLTGWTDLPGGFVSLFLNQLTPITPSVDCVTTNSAFTDDASGWTLSNLSWKVDFGGTVKYDPSALASISQDNILTVGETYEITVSYYAPVVVEACSPAGYADSFIKIFAGNNSYQEDLINTLSEPGELKTIVVELTCTDNATLSVEVQDPNSCFASGNGANGVCLAYICAVLKTNDTNPTGPSPLPSVQYVDNAEVPSRINGVDYNTKLLQFQDCLAKKGTTFYNKVVGAVKCDYRELSKLKLILELLNQKDQDRALDCIYDRVSFPTAVYQEIPCDVTVYSIEKDTNTFIVDGDYSQFETFVVEVAGVPGFSSSIVDASYDVLNGQTTIVLADYFTGGAAESTFCLTQDKESTTTYLETFINFANSFCSDCIVTGPAPTPTAGTTPSLEIAKTTLVSETGVPITTEFNQQITI